MFHGYLPSPPVSLQWTAAPQRINTSRSRPTMWVLPDGSQRQQDFKPWPSAKPCELVRLASRAAHRKRETSGWARVGVQTLWLFNMRAASSPACLSPLLLCLCVLQRSYGTPSPPSPTFTHNQTKLPDGEKDSHHRPKRGWIWNQFFVLEEHIGSDAQYVGKVRALFFVSICVQVWESGDYLKQTELLHFVWFVEWMVSPKSAVLTRDNGCASCFLSLIEMCDVTVFL